MEAATTTFEVPGINCEHCKAAIEGAVSSAAGVRQTVVDVEGRQVTVVHDPDIARIANIVGLIEDQGYTVDSWEPVTQ